MKLVLTNPTQTSSSNIPGMEVSIIGGQSMITFQDPNRNGKKLTISEHPILFTNNTLTHNKWLNIGNTTGIDSAYIAEYDGTIVATSGQCSDTGSSSKDIHLIINNIDKGPIGSFSGGQNAIFINTTINIDVNQGDLIRLIARDGTPGKIKDSIIKLTLKWRG